MVKARTVNKRKGKHARRAHRGGSGAGWTAGGPLVPGLALGNAQLNKVYDGCLSADRPGATAFSNTGGLPWKMSGGAYTNNLQGANLGGFAQIDRDASHCMSNHANPLNNGRLMQGGGAAGAASSAPILEQHTARYTGTPSQWNDSVGSKVWLNQALDGNMWSKSCSQTGGRRRGNKSATRKASKSRKTRKSKSRKA